MTDDETYLRPVHDLASVRACYDAYGVVGVTGVLTKAECEATLADLGDLAGFVVRDPTTYGAADKSMNRYGVIGDKPLFTRQLLRNRVHGNVIAAYSAVYGLPATELLAQHDRAAVMRPTAGHPEWDTPYVYPGLHLDVEPQSWAGASADAVHAFLAGLSYHDAQDFVAENNAKHWSMGRQVQGVLSLIDNRHDDGGFQCVPMADPASWLRRWATSGSVVFTEPCEPNGKYLFDARAFGKLGLPKVRVPCPAGTLLLFDACLPHGTEPNRSARPRAIQFVRYTTKATIPHRAHRVRALRRLCEAAGFDEAPPGSTAASVLFG